MMVWSRKLRPLGRSKVYEIPTARGLDALLLRPPALLLLVVPVETNLHQETGRVPENARCVGPGRPEPGALVVGLAVERERELAEHHAALVVVPRDGLEPRAHCGAR